MKNENLSCLLAPDESPAFTLVNPEGEAPLLIACDHASNVVPRSLDGLGIDSDLLELHIAYDIGAKQVAKLLSERFNAPLLTANYSRLVLDLNRYPDDDGCIPEVSDGHIITRNQAISSEDREIRIDTLFRPYHQVHSDQVQRLKGRFAQPIILSVHSFTEAMQGVARPWQFGVLWDRQEALAQRFIQNLRVDAERSQPPLMIGDNEPYHARHPLGYSMFEHAEKQGVEMGLIEIRQDLIGDQKGQEWAADILYNAVLPLLDTTPLG